MRWWWWWCLHCRCCCNGGAAPLLPLPPGGGDNGAPAAIVAAMVVLVVVVLPPLPSPLPLLWWWWWWWCGLAHLTWHPCCLSLCSLPHPILSLLTPISPCNTLAGCPGVLHSRLVLVQAGKCQHSYLAEFQTPTFFNRNFNFNCSTFSRAPKTMRIIFYTLMEMHIKISFKQL